VAAQETAFAADGAARRFEAGGVHGAAAEDRTHADTRESTAMSLGLEVRGLMTTSRWARGLAGRADGTEWVHGRRGDFRRQDSSSVRYPGAAEGDG